MIRSGIWYLEHWNKFHSKYYGDVGSFVFDGSRSKTERTLGWSWAVAYALTTGLAPAVFLGISPYHYIYHGASTLDLGWRTALRAEGGYLAHSTATSRWILGGSDDVLKLRYGRLLAAKAGSRLIPYVGWSLLAYDLYNVGKWYLESDFDNDPSTGW